jgi:hypothetical protein
MADATDWAALAADLRAWAGRLDRYRRFYDAGPGELGEPGVDTLRLAADTLDRLAMEVTGERKAKELLSAGLESTCERYDALKHECRRLRAVVEACEVAMDTAALHGLPRQMPPAYRDSWASAHAAARDLLARTAPEAPE